MQSRDEEVATEVSIRRFNAKKCVIFGEGDVVIGLTKAILSEPWQFNIK